MKVRDKAELYHELAKLVRADFHLDRSVQLLLDQGSSGERRQVLTAVQGQLGQGEKLSAALQALPEAMNGLDVALVEAGESSGRLAEGLDQLARYYETLEKARRQARTAMIYPLILLHLGVVLPEIPAVISGGAGGLSMAMAVVLRLSVLWGGILVLGWVWRRMVAAAEHRPAADGVLRSLPLVGAVRRHWSLARFCQVAHSGLLAAMRPQEWLRLAGAASGSGTFRRSAAKAAEQVAEGEPVSTSLRQSGGFPNLFLNGLQTAEEVGGLDAEMARWATLETQAAGDATTRAANWLPKVLYGIIVLYVAYRIVTMVHGIYGGLLEQTGF